MKTCSYRLILFFSLALLACVCLTAGFVCRADNDEAPAGSLSAENLEILAAPYALYPDALVAQVLPAATFPREVTLASRWVRAHPHLELAELMAQPWDSSVRAVARFPVVINALDENLDATAALGDAFVYQQTDLMDAIQRLRARFRARGVLVDTPQQRIVLESGIIQIVPANPGVIYVPCYTPEVEFGEAGAIFSIGPLTFDAEIAIGSWLDLDFDWHRHHLFFGHFGRHGEWDGRGGRIWSHPGFERRHYEVDFHNLRNVHFHNVERFPGRVITNTPPHPAGHAEFQNAHIANKENITKRAAMPNAGSTALIGHNAGTTENKHSSRGQISRETAGLSAPPHETAHKAQSAPPKLVQNTPTKPVVRKEPAALKVGNAAAERAASSRGSASRVNAGLRTSSNDSADKRRR